jgi:hypothetical protein
MRDKNEEDGKEKKRIRKPPGCWDLCCKYSHMRPASVKRLSPFFTSSGWPSRQAAEKPNQQLDRVARPKERREGKEKKKGSRRKEGKKKFWRRMVGTRGDVMKGRVKGNLTTDSETGSERKTQSQRERLSNVSSALFLTSRVPTHCQVSE